MPLLWTDTSFNRRPILPLVWHSQDAFSTTAGWAAASLKPSQPFHHRHHKSLISPCLGSFSPAINLPFRLHPASPPSLLLLFSCHRFSARLPLLFYPSLFSPSSPSRWIRCFSCCKEQTARGDLAPGSNGPWQITLSVCFHLLRAPDGWSFSASGHLSLLLSTCLKLWI